jgi:hypothetical protein
MLDLGPTASTSFTTIIGDNSHLVIPRESALWSNPRINLED